MMSRYEDDMLERWRKTICDLGYGDNVTESQISPEGFLKECEARFREANEWVESQLWRNDCYLKGHPDLDDCYECDPRLRLEVAEAIVERVREWHDHTGYFPNKESLSAILDANVPEA